MPTEFMPERTLFYWSKMYTAQVKSAEEQDANKKSIKIAQNLLKIGLSVEQVTSAA